MTHIAPNDNISKSLKPIIGKLPAKYAGTENYLDLISWNLRWFNFRETERVKNISLILSYLNADIFVFQEVEKDSLEGVKEILKNNKAGLYETYYGTTGGGQRVAFMWDTEWIRPKDDINELFGKRTVMTGDNKDAFPRLPLWGHFLAKTTEPGKSGFTFQLVGLHLKSQMGDGGSQRRTAADKLAYWLEKESNDIDADSVLIGDWNKSPEDRDWQPLHNLEKEKKVKFQSINDASDFSHLYYQNKNDIGSRLDIALVSSSAAKNMVKKKTDVARWTTIDDLLASINQKTVVEIKKILDSIEENVSDHLPLYTRLYSFDK